MATSNPTESTPGQGPPPGEAPKIGWPFTLVLIPGLVNTAEVWGGQFSVLSAEVPTFVAEHKPGTGTIEAMAANLLLAHHGPLALAGHSMGGRIALEAARLAPARIVGLALLDTGFQRLAEGDNGAAELRRRRALVTLAGKLGMRAMLAEWIRGMVAPARLADRELVEAITAMMARSSVPEFATQVRALINRPDARDVLARFPGPALVLCGAEDSWAPPAQHAAMASLLVNAELVVIPGCGHMAPMEQPAELLGHLLGWIRRVGKSMREVEQE